MDTDVEMIKPIDDILHYKGVTCFQSEANAVSTGFLACEKGFPLFKEFLSEYDNMSFLQEDGSYALIPNNSLLTNLCVKYGLVCNNMTQTVKGLTVLPRDYFSPKNPITKEIVITRNTYVIHHFEGSWNSDIKDYGDELKSKYKFLPEKAVKFIAYMKLRGFRAAARAARRYVHEKNTESGSDKNKSQRC